MQAIPPREDLVARRSLVTDISDDMISNLADCGVSISVTGLDLWNSQASVEIHVT